MANPISGVGAAAGQGKPISGVGAAGQNQAMARSAQSNANASVPGTSTSWHTVVLWFLGAMALLALASPAPNIATLIVVLLIAGTLLNNWSTYASYLGLK